MSLLHVCMRGIASSRNPTFNTTIGQESDLRAYNMYAGFIGYATTFALLGLFVGIFVCFSCKHLPDCEIKMDSATHHVPIFTSLCTRLCCPNPPYKVTEEEKQRSRFNLHLSLEMNALENPNRDEEI